MSVDSFVPEKFSVALSESLKRSCVYAGPLAVVRDFDIFDGAPFVTQAKCWGFGIDNLDDHDPQVPAAATSELAYALAEVMDQHVAGAYTEAANQLASVTITTDGYGARVYDHCLIPLKTALDAADVPTADRYVIVPPVVYGLLMRDPRFIADDGSQLGRNGLVGHAAGLNVLMSNSCPAATADTYVIIAGIPQAITFAEKVDEVKGCSRPSSFMDAVEGVTRYGYRVVRPDLLASCTVTII